MIGLNTILFDNRLYLCLLCVVFVLLIGSPATADDDTMLCNRAGDCISVSDIIDMQTRIDELEAALLCAWGSIPICDQYWTRPTTYDKREKKALRLGED